MELTNSKLKQEKRKLAIYCAVAAGAVGVGLVVKVNSLQKDVNDLADALDRIIQVTHYLIDSAEHMDNLHR